MPDRQPTISVDDFFKVDIRIGCVVEARPNFKARKPAYILTIDFGSLGMKTSSAQLTEQFTAADLIGKQVVAVVNFPVKRIADVRSEVLVLAATCDRNGTAALIPAFPVVNGTRVL